MHLRDVNISPIRSIQRAIEVLSAFTVEQPELTLEQVSDRTGLPKATTYRILYTMEVRDLIRYDERTLRYRLGLQFLSFAGLVAASYDIVQESEDVLVDLHLRVKQTILMSVMLGDEMIYVFRRENAEGLKFSSFVGQRRPLPYGVVGKVMLAYLPNEQADRILQKPIQGTTPNSITDPNGLRQMMERIRQQGYHIDVEQTTVGVCGVAAPIFDIHDRMVASVGVIGPTVQLLDTIETARDMLLDATATISTRMGHRTNALRFDGPRGGKG